MSTVLDLLAAQPLELLFLVLAVGYAVGRLSWGGVQLGVAAVLFAGLAAGMLDPRLQLPEFVRGFGLVVFVYAIGVSSGPAFMASFKQRGLRDSLWTVALLGLGAALASWGGRTMGLAPDLIAGLYCGALTNTAALAALLERASASGSGTVVGYSIAYPAGALGIVLALAVARRLWQRDLVRAAQGTQLTVQSLRVTQPGAVDVPLKRLLADADIRARFVRRRRGDHWELLHPDEGLSLGDVVTAVGLPEALARLTTLVGEPSEDREGPSASGLELRRIFVSDPAVAGRALADLRTLTRFGALVTRIRRGDADLVPDGRTVLELGDRVRVIAPHERMAEVSRFFGDSYRALGEIDAVSFGLGAALGMLLGLLPVPLPGGATFKLGPAGGPLVVGLILGAAGRTGPIVWQVPYSASLTLRQLGLALFLAAVGVNAGAPFARTLATPDGLRLLALGAVITVVVAALALWTSRAWLKAPPGIAMGLASGVHTQPAGLAFASETTRDESPGLGYSTVSPIATLAKIILAQLLLGR